MKYDSDNQRIHRIASVIKKEIAQIIQNDINDLVFMSHEIL